MREDWYFGYNASKQIAELMEKIRELEKENKELKEKIKEQK